MYESDNIKHQEQMRPAVHIKDRISNMAAIVLAFFSRENISFPAVGKSVILKIVDSARMLYSGPNIRVVT